MIVARNVHLVETVSTMNVILLNRILTVKNVHDTLIMIWCTNCIRICPSCVGNYAHGKHELKFQYTTLSLMEKSGSIVNAKTHLSRPCMTWVSTGAW